jgi:hypothetical protein
MHQSRLYEILLALNKDDWKSLDKCVASSFFNRHEPVILYWTYLWQCLRNEKQPTKEKAWEAIWPNEPYEDTRMRNAMTRLLGVVEEYLILRYYRKEKTQKSLALVKELRSLNLKKHLESYTETLQITHNETNWRNADFFHQSFEIEIEKYTQLSLMGQLAESNHQLILDNLDSFYLTQKLRQACILKAYNAIYKKDFNDELLLPILNYLQSSNKLQIPAIGIYFYCYKSLAYLNDESSFEKFKQLFLENGTIFPPTERRELFLLAINYCIRRKNAGASAYSQEALIMYKESLNDDILLFEGLISQITFNNIVATALIEKEYNWAEKFIADFVQKLDDDMKEQTKSYNLAKIEFAKKHYLKASEYINIVEFKDPLTTLAAKTLFAKIYFETQEWGLLDSTLDKIQNFIQRKKNLPAHGEHYKNFKKYTKKIHSIGDFEKQELNAILLEIKNPELKVAERVWLIEKTMALIKA